MTSGFGPLAHGAAMAFNDVISLGLLKAIHLEWLSSYYFIVPLILYMAQPFLFFSALNVESMAVMNIMWDLLSDVLVTLSGIYIFKEKISNSKLLGILLAMVSMYLLTSESKL
jgi:multidrug transporter EmrE-like cation transporter